MCIVGKDTIDDAPGLLDLEELGDLVMAMLWRLNRTEVWSGQSYAARYRLERVEPVYPQIVLRDE
jgi:hypothetical protein